MILVVGGIASGKRTFAGGLGYAPQDMSTELDSAASVLVDAQELVRGSDVDPMALAAAVAGSKRVVLCAEVGSGVVPLGREERAWREHVGALQKELARQAEVVVRMVCGIPVVLKGTLPGKEA